jgi:serine/threonine-protein kinase RsbW
MPGRFEIQVPGHTRHLGVVRKFFETVVDEHDEIRFGTSEIHEIQLVLQEACINVIRHSHPDGRSEPVRVRFLFDERGMIVEIIDRGKGYDPESVPEPRPEDLQEGGYGVFIMKQAMDRVDTRRDEDGFVLSLTRRYRAPTPAGAGES